MSHIEGSTQLLQRVVYPTFRTFYLHSNTSFNDNQDKPTFLVLTILFVSAAQQRNPETASKQEEEVDVEGRSFSGFSIFSPHFCSFWVVCRQHITSMYSTSGRAARKRGLPLLRTFFVSVRGMPLLHFRWKER